jgi:hypothetical protein
MKPRLLCAQICASLFLTTLLAVGGPLRAEVTEPAPAAVIPHDAADLFGAATATDAHTLLVGAPVADGKGAVHVFYREGNGFSSWKKHEVLRPTYAGPIQLFGISTAYAQNVAAIGTFHGPIFVFERAPFSLDFTQTAVIELAMDDIASFGPGSLSVSSDGVLAFGQKSDSARGLDEAGSVLLYTRTAAGWQFNARIEAADPRENAMFGTAVMLLGDFLVVGAPGDEDVPGAVYVFERVAGTWQQRQKIAAPPSEVANYFGESLTTNGGQLVVGAPGDGVQSTGHVYLYEKLPPTFAEFTFTKELVPEEPLPPGARYGHGLAIDGNNRNIVVTRLAPASTIDTQEPGAGYVFTLGLNGWNQRLTMAPTANEFPSSFGVSVAAGSTHAVIGDYGTTQEPGAVYVYDINLPQTDPVFLAAPADQTIDAPPGQSAEATFEATVGDENGDDLFVHWEVDGDEVERDFVDGGWPMTRETVGLTTTLTPGPHMIRIIARERNTDRRTEHRFHVTVGDAAGPEILSITARPSVIPAQHGRFVLVRLRVVATDPSGPVRWKITSVESSDPTTPPRRGQLGDWRIISARQQTVMVRAATSNPATDRVYTIHIEASDALGNTTEGETQVRIVAPANRRVRR